MRLKKLLPGLILLFIIHSCATQQLINEGNTAYQEGNYDSALTAWDQAIEIYQEKGKKADAAVYFNAGRAAMEVEQYERAGNYLSVADYLQYDDPALYTLQAEIYNTIDNLSKEMTALESYLEKYPGGEKNDAFTVRLFETYVESKNWQWAADLWPNINQEARSTEKLLTSYLVVQKQLGNADKSTQLAAQLLKMNANNLEALEWFAKSNFKKAEDLYVNEMKAYKNNRTTKQYKRLLKKLDIAYEDYRTSRDYFLKLYKLSPKSEYAKYLGDIYTRLAQKKKAAYYYKKAQ